MIGLDNEIVILKKHKKVWEELYQKEKELISQQIGKYVKEIQHIGSTSIPEIVAKPILDLAIALDSLANMEKVIEKLEEIGYEYKGKQGDQERYMFVKQEKNCTTHHLHVMEKDSLEWKKHVVFRDYLISHPSEAKKYEKLKIKLGKKYRKEREKYTEGKEKFIKKTLEKAKKKEKEKV
ncbi:MAG: GrpB family protein [Candidatus Heimdallarchaeaceae archaeon]